MMKSKTFKNMWKSNFSFEETFDHCKITEKPFIFPLNGISKICFEKVVEWLDQHNGKPDPVIKEDPITTEV
jgi:hypothetical protein